MNTVDPWWIHGKNLKTYHSLLHIMNCNKDTDVFLILTFPFYGTSSNRKRIRAPIYPGYRRDTNSMKYVLATRSEKNCSMEHLPTKNGSTDLSQIPPGYQFNEIRVSDGSNTDRRKTTFCQETCFGYR
jgi:hypothetical protein